MVDVKILPQPIGRRNAAKMMQNHLCGEED